MSSKGPRARGALTLPTPGAGVLEPATRERLLEITREVLARPTAPYAEDLQVAYVRAFVRARPGLELRADRHGNLLVRWPGRGRGKASTPLAFSAHLDHPGFRYLGRRAGVHRAEVHGGVPGRHAVGGDVAFFELETGATLARARVARVRATRGGRRTVELSRFEGKAPRGSFGTWDLAAARRRGTRLHARVCDDLMGVAATLTVLDVLREQRSPRPLLGIFTRAEETGFVGCQGLLRDGTLPKGTRVVGLECSPHRASARLGAGPVIRVGDAASQFDPDLGAELLRAARALRERLGAFPFQRALMDGGSCESSAYNAWGVPAGGLCLALENYHNAGEKGSLRGGIAPEVVDWNDYEGLVALMLEVTRTLGAAAGSASMRGRLDSVWKRERALLAESSRRMRARGESRTPRKLKAEKRP